MAKLRAIFTVLVILVCVSISECRTQEIQCDIKCQLCDKVLKRPENKPKEINEIIKNVCNLNKEVVCGSRPVNLLEKIKSKGQCKREWMTTDPTCQEVANYLCKPNITSLVSYLERVCGVLKQNQILTVAQPRQSIIRVYGVLKQGKISDRLKGIKGWFTDWYDSCKISR